MRKFAYKEQTDRDQAFQTLRPLYPLWILEGAGQYSCHRYHNWTYFCRISSHVYQGPSIMFGDIAYKFHFRTLAFLTPPDVRGLWYRWKY